MLPCKNFWRIPLKEKIKAWFKRHRFTTWFLVFVAIGLLDMPIRFYTQWIWITDMWRIEFWFDLGIQAFFFILGWSIANIVRDRWCNA